MEKEQILQQLEEKLSPFVTNFKNGQPEEHDFFPALLWMLLQKSRDLDINISKSAETTQKTILQDNTEVKNQLEALLNEIPIKNREDITKIAVNIIKNNQENAKETTRIINEAREKNEEHIKELNTKHEQLLKKITEHFSQKIEGMKNWFFIFAGLHVITLTILTIILVKK
jgi:DNA anti-recombination protein RmuC